MCSAALKTAPTQLEAHGAAPCRAVPCVGGGGSADTLAGATGEARHRSAAAPVACAGTALGCVEQEISLRREIAPSTAGATTAAGGLIPRGRRVPERRRARSFLHSQKTIYDLGADLSVLSRLTLLTHATGVDR